jgi:hypothetical protein
MERRVVKIVIIVAVALGIYFIVDELISNSDQSRYMYEAANDSLRVSRNKYGQEVSKRLVIEANREKDFLRMVTQDSIIKDLQREVRDYKGKVSAMVISTHTTTSSGSSVTNVISSDSAKYPTYETSWDGEWDAGTIVATKDSILHDIDVKNKFSFTIGQENNGWFKRRVSTLTAVNSNPNTVTNGIHSFQIKQRGKRFAFGVFVGLDIVTLKPTAGIGGVYTIVYIK